MAQATPLDTAHPADIGLNPQRTQQVVNVLQDSVDRQHIPGAVVMVARQGRIGLFEAIGQQDPATGKPMRTDSIFRIYSMTKPLVSVAIMMLVERGRLLISDPVSRWLPEYNNQPVLGNAGLVPAWQTPTVQDLLRHTAGLTYEFLGDSPVQREYAKVNIASRGRSNDEFSKALAGIPLQFQPRSCWAYSRATDVLGRLVEVISGQTLGQFLQHEIFDPLGMVDTGFAVPPAQQHRIVEPFGHDPDGGVPMKLLSRHTLAFMTADHLGDIPIDGTLLPPGHGFGLGFAVRRAAGESPVPGSVGTYHWSGIGGTSFFVDPAQDLYAMLLTQAPNQRDHYRQLLRNLVYAALT